MPHSDTGCSQNVKETTLQTIRLLYETHTWQLKRMTKNHVSVWNDVDGVPLKKSSHRLQIASSYFCRRTKQNHAFVYVHLHMCKYTEHVLELYKPGNKRNYFLGGEWDWVGVKGYFAVSILLKLFIVRIDCRNRWIIHYLYSLKIYNLYILKSNKFKQEEEKSSLLEWSGLKSVFSPDFCPMYALCPWTNHFPWQCLFPFL